MYRFHRIFCATPWELEGERRRFYDLAGQFNETWAMPQGMLFTPVALVNIRDKRPLQCVLEENIQDSTGYIQLLQDGWGPVERNFENDYLLARQLLANPARPMRRVALIRKIPLSGKALEAGIPKPQSEFSTMEEFDKCILGEMTRLLETLIHAPEKSSADATA
jgi:hypothetical protein